MQKRKQEKNKNAEEARAQTLAEAARAEKAATEAEREEKKANDAANAAREKEIAEAGNYLKRDGGVKKEKIVEEKKVEIKKIKIPSKLKKLLPTEKEIEEITNRTIWKYVDNQHSMNKETGIEIMTSLLRDITRVYDPIVSKYKVATIQIKIIKYNDEGSIRNLLE